jgi:hypothetical protein
MAGRPKIKTNILPEGWVDAILQLYSDGASDVEIRAYLATNRTDANSFSDDLWERLIKEDEEFSRTIKRGKMLSEAWWVRMGRINLTSRDFNFTGWYMNMKNRFGWKDKTETDLHVHELPPIPTVILNRR